MADNNGIFTLNEFRNRGVIKLAPEVLVYIGGSLQASVIAPVDGKDSKLSFNDGITTVGVQNNVDPPGSSTATIEIVTPIYGEKSKYWTTFTVPETGGFVRAPVLVPMMEVKIYFRGRFLVEGTPQYYPAFWGFISNVEESFSGGIWKINLTCADMLHWWSYSTLNVHPNVESDIFAGGNQTLTVFSTIFEDSNPFKIIHTLTGNMGMNQFVTSTWAAQLTPLNTIYPTDLLRKATTGIMEYWQERFANTANLLKMYGLAGEQIDEHGNLILTAVPDVAPASDTQKATQSKNKYVVKSDTDFLKKFTVFFDFEKMADFQNAEYMTKLEIATEVKTRCDYEFYQDVNGNFVFKPPFYNLPVNSLMPYSIAPLDVISSSFGVDAEGICTVLTVNTPFDQQVRMTTYALGKGFHMDIDLTKRYGVRHREITMEYISDEHLARSLALGQMSTINMKTITGNVTMPGRPEIRLGYPVYLEHRDSYHYVKSINHSFDYGGSFTTTLSLEGERRRMYDPKTGSPLKDYIYSLATENIVEKKSNPDDIDSLVVKGQDKTQQDMYMANNRIISMQQGRYELAPRESKTSGGFTDGLLSDLRSVSLTTVPYTDEEGYQVIGAFPYGRNVNPLCIDGVKTSNGIIPKFYAITMAKPANTNESDEMTKIFNQYPENKEGAVPMFMGVAGESAAAVLGVQQKTILSSTPRGEKYNADEVSVKVREDASKKPAETTTNMTPAGQTNTPTVGTGN
jgi:hypothetical protein